MLFLIRNEVLITNRERTYLTAPVSVAATALTVKAVDSNAWANNDWVIVGEIGSKNAEILQINGAVTDGTSLTIDNAGSGGSRFAHSIDEPVYRIDYNQLYIYRNTVDSTTGLSTVTSGVEIQPDDLETRYEDSSNSTGYGFVRFYNSQTGAFSEYSDGIPYTGYTAKSLGRMLKMIRRHLGEESYRFIEDSDLIEEINEKQRDIAHERLWPFYENIFSASSVAYQRAYDISTSVVPGKVHFPVFKSEPLIKIDDAKFQMLGWDTARTGEPTHVRVWDNKLEFYPLPTTSAQTTTLDGSLSASATSVTVTSTSGFSPSGRLIVDSEVMSYSNTSTTQFLGLVRGLEGTTAASHLTAATITERDIVYTAHEEPTELIDIQDETQIPDPGVLVYGVTSEIATGKLNDPTLGDRMKIKYNEALERLRDKFGKKITSAAYRIKDKDEVLRDSAGLRNPNDYPVIS